jgi:hypothetical protein
MNFQLDRFVVETRPDNSYDLEDKAADSDLKAACSPVVFKEQKRRSLIVVSSRRRSSSHQRPIDWLDVLDNANGSIGRLLIEDVQKLGRHSASIVVLIPKPNPLDDDKSEIFNNLLRAIKAKSIENYPFEIQRRENEQFLQLPFSSRPMEPRIPCKNVSKIRPPIPISKLVPWNREYHARIFGSE